MHVELEAALWEKGRQLERMLGRVLGGRACMLVPATQLRADIASQTHVGRPYLGHL